MENMDFIAALNELTSQENLLAVSRDVNELRGKFEDYLLDEERKFQVLELEAEEKEEPKPEKEGDFGKEAFYAIFDVYNIERKRLIDERTNSEAANLAEKRAIIVRLKAVVTSEENIGAAFGAFKEIQDKWKEVGNIPRDSRNDIQKEYSKLLEDFFYNINIYKQLKEHDFKRNQELKTTIIENLKSLQKEEKMKELETKMRGYQNDWDEIGPVPNEAWELLKEAYWTEIRSLNNRVNRFYEDRRDQQRENIEKKTALITELKELLADQESWEGSQAWEAKTKLVIDLQNRWKTIGFGPRKENESVWKEFRAVCDAFFDGKKAFYSVVNTKFDAIAEKKKALIERANKLKDQTNWKDTSEQLIRLQKDWKTLGHAGRKNEQKLWKAFRGACDAFFTAKQDHFSSQDEEQDANGALKVELLKTMEAYKVPADKATALAELKQFSADFNAIGRVPMKIKDATYNSFKKIMDTHYGALKMEGAEKETILFQARIDTISASSNASRLFQDVKMDLRKDIDKEQKEIHQLENNLGFFANSKGAEALKKGVELKVEQAQEKIKTIKLKLKMIPNE
ncbi:MAG: hypothetical protein ACI865_000657 [Flavobacteriaceae bacterium]|jgi:hypothetical protein